MIYVKRKSDGQVFPVQEYIHHNDGQESVWVNEWYGHHKIGIDCEWFFKFEPLHYNALVDIANFKPFVTPTGTDYVASYYKLKALAEKTVKIGSYSYDPVSGKYLPDHFVDTNKMVEE